MKSGVYDPIRHKTRKNLPIRIVCLVWIVLAIFVQWLVFGMPGINKVTNIPPRFLLELIEMLARFFTGKYVF